MGFQQETMRGLSETKEHESTMTTYYILSHKTPKGNGHTITVSPFPNAKPSMAGSSYYLSHSVYTSGRRSKRWPVHQPAWTGAPPCLHPRLSIPSAGPEPGFPSPSPKAESGTTSPAAELEPGTATSSPVPHLSSWESISMDSTSSNIGSGAPERQPGRETPPLAQARARESVGG